ncbi:hypothetical protein K1719_036996 [Acacia pycnantha]|nr:hypothetical protein K1719_036996 [Acacia pycnantha]
MVIAPDTLSTSSFTLSISSSLPTSQIRYRYPSVRSLNLSRHYVSFKHVLLVRLENFSSRCSITDILPIESPSLLTEGTYADSLLTALTFCQKRNNKPLQPLQPTHLDYMLSILAV